MASYSLGKVWNDTQCNKENEMVRFTMKMIEEKQADTIVLVACDGYFGTCSIAGAYNKLII